MRLTQLLRSVGLPWRVSALAFSLALTLGAGVLTTSPTAHAANSFTWINGYSVQGSWLCYGTSTWLHCTQHWGVSHGRYLSYNPAWVPSQGAAPAPASAPPPAPPPAPAASAPAPQSYAAPSASAGGIAGDFCAGESRNVWSTFTGNRWQTPPGCMAGIFSPNRAAYYQPNAWWGQCSWWPSALLHVPSPGALPLHSAPKVHSIAYWNVAANGGGSEHFAFVESISPDGHWLLTSQMNMYWRGGGFGRVIFVYEPMWSVTGFFY